MAELKTRINDSSVTDFLDAVEDDVKRGDSYRLLELMSEVTGKQARMWGASIVGFGSYHYRYASGREGTWPMIGFSPRKQNISIYIMSGFSGYGSKMTKLGKHKTGKSCLYVNKLSDVDLDVLRDLASASVAWMQKKYECDA